MAYTVTGHWFIAFSSVHKFTKFTVLKLLLKLSALSVFVIYHNPNRLWCEQKCLGVKTKKLWHWGYLVDCTQMDLEWCWQIAGWHCWMTLLERQSPKVDAWHFTDQQFINVSSIDTLSNEVSQNEHFVERGSKVLGPFVSVTHCHQKEKTKQKKWLSWYWRSSGNHCSVGNWGWVFNQCSWVS